MKIKNEIETKIILIEKKPFEVTVFQKTRNANIGLVWWYEYNKSYCVKNLISFDELKRDTLGLEKIINNYKPSEFYIVLNGKNRKNDKAIILKKDCIKNV